MFKYLKQCSTLFFGLFYISSGFASDFHSPRTAALGGAGHAGPLLNDSIYLNPSYISFIRAHGLSFNYLKYGDGLVQTPEGLSEYYGNNMNISVLDGTPSSIFQAGVGYTRRNDANFIHVGASKSIVDKYGIGLGGKFIFPKDNSGQKYNEGYFSTTGAFAKWIQTALIIDNLFESAKSLGFYREFTLGTKFNLSSVLLVYIDPHYVPNLPDDQSKWGYEAGVEFPFTIDLYLRLGTFRNSTIPFEALRGDGWGIGAGWLGPKLSLDYAYSRVIRPIPATSHNFGVTLFF